ncbi:hypothetical protein [Streptosporangium sp. NPDC087985]|uniref:hypothetical protein n=1 Tax=Streptosporangium sp. NPDC087985 TaxID=3366196 RepID=UPI0038243BB3
MRGHCRSPGTGVSRAAARRATPYTLSVGGSPPITAGLGALSLNTDLATPYGITGTVPMRL